MEIAFSRRVVDSTAIGLPITKASACRGIKSKTIVSLNMVYTCSQHDVGRKYKN